MSKDIKIHDINYYNNHPDYGLKKDPNFRRQYDVDKIHDWIENIDWEAESNYHNTYYVNGKWNKGRTIKMKNKDWHKLNKS